MLVSLKIEPRASDTIHKSGNRFESEIWYTELKSFQIPRRWRWVLQFLHVIRSGNSSAR
jgi:hypothetical protein